jgi:hypothetical protein
VGQKITHFEVYVAVVQRNVIDALYEGIRILSFYVSLGQYRRKRASGANAQRILPQITPKSGLALVIVGVAGYNEGEERRHREVLQTSAP